MGRGRAKAKQTKVARELKYSSRDTDLDALRAELARDRSDGPHDSPAYEGNGGDPGEDEDPYADYATDEDDEDDELED
jgi:hypothetical protein